jgi:hypothetical protein
VPTGQTSNAVQRAGLLEIRHSRFDLVLNYRSPPRIEVAPVELEPDPFIDSLGADYPTQRAALIEQDLATTLTKLKASIGRWMTAR